MNPLMRIPRNLALGVALAAGSYGAAAADIICDFESGDLEPCFGSGDVDVTDTNVLDGAFSAIITTGPGAVGGDDGVCSHLLTPFVDPPTDRALARVSVLVRYKTDEAVGPLTFFEDPFHAEFVTQRGALDVVTIKTDGLFFTRSSPTRTRVTNEATGDRLPQPPQIPAFNPGDEFGSETDILKVESSISLAGCEPVRYKFQICDWSDDIVDSAAVVDLVDISFTDSGAPCSEALMNPEIMESEGVEDHPAPRK